MKKALLILAVSVALSSTAAFAARLIGEERAVKEAMTAAKMQRNEIKSLKTELRGVAAEKQGSGAEPVYIVSFEHGNMSYICEINAGTAAVISVRTRPFRSH